jgi:hypothetical protein
VRACVSERARESTASASHHLARPAPLVPRAPAPEEMLVLLCKIVCFSLVEIIWRRGTFLCWSGTLVWWSWHGECLAVGRGYRIFCDHGVIALTDTFSDRKISIGYPV